MKVTASGAYASHFTAAEIWGGWVPHQPLTHISVAAGETRSRRQGLKAHEAKGSVTVLVHQRVRVSSPVDTFLAMAALLDLVDLVVLGDSLVRQSRTTPERLVQAASVCSGPGARLARRAARLVRRGVDSPMESRLRMLIVLAGLPEPRVNWIVYDDNGKWRMRFDLSYPALRLVIEYDDRQHAEDDTQWDRDIERREDMDRLRLRMVVVRPRSTAAAEH